MNKFNINKIDKEFASHDEKRFASGYTIDLCKKQWLNTAISLIDHGETRQALIIFNMFRDLYPEYKADLIEEKLSLIDNKEQQSLADKKAQKEAEEKCAKERELTYQKEKRNDKIKLALKIVIPIIILSLILGLAIGIPISNNKTKYNPDNVVISLVSTSQQGVETVYGQTRYYVDFTFSIKNNGPLGIKEMGLQHISIYDKNSGDLIWKGSPNITSSISVGGQTSLTISLYSTDSSFYTKSAYQYRIEYHPSHITYSDGKYKAF